MSQEQNSTTNNDDGGGLAVLAVFALFGVLAWLATRREWLHEQGVLEYPDQWTPTFRGWLVIVALAVALVCAIVGLIAGASYRTTVRETDGVVRPPLASRAAVVALAAAAIAALFVLVNKIGLLLAVLGIIVVVALAYAAVYALARPAHRAQVVTGTAKHANSYAGYAGTGNRSSFIKVTRWTGGRLDPIPVAMTVRVGDHFDYRGNQAGLIAQEVGAYVSDLRGRHVTYQVDTYDRSARRITLTIGE